MSKFNFSIYLNAYEDRHPSNAPSLNNFKWARDLHSLAINNPTNQSLQAAPGSTTLLFNSMRMLAQDGTTEYSISLKSLTNNTYILANVGGTAPNFRTPRVTGASASTSLTSTTNGQVVTFTSGAFAFFTGQIPGMISNVTITANTIGTGGNSVILAGDGVSSISALITAWNTANPSNQVTLTSGNGSQVPDAGEAASFNGTVSGLTSAVVITANTLGTVGNSISLVGDGTSSVSTLISAWNTANPSNQITLTSGDGTQIPNGGVAAFFSGTPTGLSTSVTITATAVGSAGNGIELIGDGASSIDTLIANWNIDNPSDTISLTAGNGAQIPAALALIQFAGGVDAAVISLAGGIDADIMLSGGANPLALSGVQVGDTVFLGNVFNPSNQGFFTILQSTATSFQIANPGGVSEGPIVLGADFNSVLQIYSAAGVQINDTLVISGGFSLASQSSYIITAVYANSLEFTSTAALPQEGPITTEAIVIYSNAKSLIYLESDSALSVIVNNVTIGDIQPIISINSRLPSLPPSIFPGVLMFNSTVWSLSIVNNGINSANVYFAAVE